MDAGDGCSWPTPALGKSLPGVTYLEKARAT